MEDIKILTWNNALVFPKFLMTPYDTLCLNRNYVDLIKTLEIKQGHVTLENEYETGHMLCCEDGEPIPHRSETCSPGCKSSSEALERYSLSMGSSIL